MPTPLAKAMTLIFAAALTLAGCGVNYHINPGPNSWPPAPKAPAQAPAPAQKG